MIYISEYGKMLDMIQSFVLQFNEDSNEQPQNRYSMDWVHENCAEPPLDMTIFFKIPEDKDASLMENLFSREGDELIGSSIEEYLDKIFNKEHIQEYVTEYYFCSKHVDTTLEQFHEMLNNSHLSNDFRYYLLSFYIDTDRFAEQLKMQMLNRYYVIERCHSENQTLISNIQSEVDREVLKELDKEIWNISVDYEQIYYSICLIADSKIERRGLGSKDGEKVCFSLGIHWKEKVLMLSRKNKIDITLFGKILSEPNRMKIIEYLLEHDEITIAQAVEFMEASVTATSYHLNMMFGAKMLKARYEGRKIFYSLQKDYFEVAIGMLRDLTDRM